MPMIDTIFAAPLDRHPMKLVVKTMTSRLALWRQRARSRQQLRQLEPHRLQDLGLEWRAAQTEADRPFWQG